MEYAIEFRNSKVGERYSKTHRGHGDFISPLSIPKMRKPDQR
jgi:hypothetical protein